MAVASVRRIVTVMISQGNETYERKLNVDNTEWMAVTVTLAGMSQLTAGGKRWNLTTGNRVIGKGTRKRIVIRNAYVLLGCPQGQQK